eukprot:TRINITY_DN6162_c0_g1_i1.p1 TRINITY_DN6162_c0_g1~~TRINITY_DN6162_c0_g1_i1.p1  ORF type:complete len:175 (-),score=45.28 TRINITY_DN6162_c0_g1_i1:129-653(-)
MSNSTNATQFLQTAVDTFVHGFKTFPTTFEAQDVFQWFFQNPVFLIIFLILFLFLLFELYYLVVGSIFKIILFIIFLPYTLLKLVLSIIWKTLRFTFRLTTGKNSAPIADKVIIVQSEPVTTTTVPSTSVTDTKEDPAKIVARLREITREQEDLQKRLLDIFPPSEANASPYSI